MLKSKVKHYQRKRIFWMYISVPCRGRCIQIPLTYILCFFENNLNHSSTAFTYVHFKSVFSKMMLGQRGTLWARSSLYCQQGRCKCTWRTVSLAPFSGFTNENDLCALVGVNILNLKSEFVYLVKKNMILNIVSTQSLLNMSVLQTVSCSTRVPTWG
jgi:hypothetical protein